MDTPGSPKDDCSSFPLPEVGQTRRAPEGLPTETDVLGRAAGENFPVALRALPGPLRHDLLAVYGFARLTDQLGDAYPGHRLAALDWLSLEVDQALTGGEAHPLVARLAGVVTAHGLDPVPMYDLIEANRVDQGTFSYQTFDDLVDYCRLSANPVGRLVLGIFDQADDQRVEWSDAICTGLQLAEHWGDVAEDAAAGRVYIPADDLQRFGVLGAELTAKPPARPALRALMAFEADRARRLLDQGAPLVASLKGWARLAVSAFVGGGYAALAGLADAGFDPLGGAPERSTRRIAVASVAVWRGRPKGSYRP